MSTPKGSNRSASALAAALNNKLDWKAVPSVIEAMKTSTALTEGEKTKLKQLLTGGDDVVLAIIESASAPEELLSDLANYVKSAFPAGDTDTVMSNNSTNTTATATAAAAATNTSSSLPVNVASAAPQVPPPVVLPANGGTPQASPVTAFSPVEQPKLNITVNSPVSALGSSVAAAAAAAVAAPSKQAGNSLPRMSPPSTPDLSSASPMMASTSPSTAVKPSASSSSGGLPALSLSEGKNFAQQIKDLETSYEAAFKLLSAFAAKDKGKEKETVKTGVRSIVKMLENLKKHPTNLQYRKLRMDNIVVKKYVTGIDGAQSVMEGVGFRKVEVGSGGKKVLYLSIDEADVKGEVLDRSIELLMKYLETSDKPADLATATAAATAAATATGPKPICAGGCGFFGEVSQQNLCSQCYKKKYPNEKTNTSTASPSSSSSAAAAATGKPAAAAAAASDKPGRVTGLCTKGCGFFGNETWKGMCSACFQKNKATVSKTWKKHIHIAMIKLRAMRQFTVITKKPVQRKKNRCWKCDIKIGITGIECKCGYLFCAAHRYAQEHDCDFDHKEMQRKKLAKENKEVKGKKLQKIGDAENES